MVSIERIYTIDNDLDAISDVVSTMMDEMRAAFPKTQPFEVALYEAIHNAIEHGNLAIPFAEKKALIESGRYDQTIASRRRTTPYAGRAVRVRMLLSDDAISFSVADEGDGFDWRAWLPDPDTTEAATGVSGRGITIMRSVFDTVSYNDRGTEVTLTKKKERPDA
ncbi:MAG TPA: ATP-binding protein [bacterium]|nr:ATP-binding protein [bacterium]